MMGSFREIVVGRPPGLPPGRMAQSVDIAYPALHNPAAFWKYDPAAFLAAPVYSRDYPPAKNIE
jgi:branched-chain amino acid transport system substrate-binding protein